MTRPVLQTGSYGENIGQIVLEYDFASGDTTTVVNQNVARATTADADLVAAYPRVAEVETIVTAALAEAMVRGSVPVGSLTADISRACLVAGLTTCAENRAAPSALGTLVANSLRESLSSDLRGGAQIGIVNPGGMRTDLTVGDDGVITYADANAVLPFLNNLWTTTLTGAQFKIILEQQWQRTATGTVPSRPYQQLGLSDNVNYTFDATRPESDRITGIWLDGVAIDPAADYRVGSFNFLLTGGDNFHEFTKGTNTVDSGLVDRDAWIDYISASSPLSPSFAATQATVTGVPTVAVAPGDSLNLAVSNVDLTSLGAVKNTEFALNWAGSTADLGTASVDADGVFAVNVTVPVDASENSVLELTSAATGTVVRVAIAVASPATTPAFTAPTTAPSFAGEAALLDGLKGLITTDEAVYAAGEQMTIDVGAQYAGQFVSIWMLSTPTNLGGWQRVTSAGFVTATVPVTATAGIHRVVVQDASGAVIGWTEIRVSAAAVTVSSLPSTGMDATPGLFAGALLLLLGAVLLMHRRRRGIVQI